MDKCGTRVTTSWDMDQRMPHSMLLSWGSLYKRPTIVWSSSIGIDCWVLPTRCISHYGFPCVFQSSIVCTLILHCPRLSGGLIQFLINCKKHNFSLTRANLQNWRKWYLTTQSLPSDDFASRGNKDDSVTPNISVHRHTMQFLWQLFTDLQNSGHIAKTRPFSECMWRTSASKTCWHGKLNTCGHWWWTA